MKTSTRILPTLSAAAVIMLLVALPLSRAFAHDMSNMGDMTGMSGMSGMSGHHMDEHMTMTSLRAAQPRDEDRARELLFILRGSLARYKNYRVAMSQGMRIFMPTVPQDVYHFVNYPATQAEYERQGDFRYPGSLLYTKDDDGSYALVGAMYSMPPDASMDALDARVPLSVARWHEHTNLCLPEGITMSEIMRGYVGGDQSNLPGMLPVSDSPHAIEMNRRLGFLADGRFGFEGSIFKDSDCTAARGHFLPLVFGWMVHVYPFSGDDLKVAYGMAVPKPMGSQRQALN